jgi:hypothetical protein
VSETSAIIVSIATCNYDDAPSSIFARHSVLSIFKLKTGIDRVLSKYALRYVQADGQRRFVDGGYQDDA